MYYWNVTDLMKLDKITCSTGTDQAETFKVSLTFSVLKMIMLYTKQQYALKNF